MLRCICVRAPSLRTLTGAPLPTLQQIPNTPTRPPLHASRTTHRSAKCLATANLVTRTEPVRVDYCAWEPFIQQREAQHMGHNLQQRPITPTHPPEPLCLATHAFNCSHTIRTQCYADVWAQAITPGCALASFDCSNMGRDLQQHPITPTHSPALIRTIHNSAKCLTTNHLASTPEPARARHLQTCRCHETQPATYSHHHSGLRRCPTALCNS